MLRIVYIHMFKQLGVRACTHPQIALSLRKKQHSERVTYVPWELGALTVHTLFCIAVFEMPSLLLCPFSLKSLYFPGFSCHRVPSLSSVPAIFFLVLSTTYILSILVPSLPLLALFIFLHILPHWFHSTIEAPSPQRQRRMMLVIAFLPPPT